MQMKMVSPLPFITMCLFPGIGLDHYSNASLFRRGFKSAFNLSPLSSEIEKTISELSRFEPLIKTFAKSGNCN